MHCLLLTLERFGYIQRTSPRGPFLCGPRLLTLSGKTLDGANLRAASMAVLRSLVQRTGLTAHLALKDNQQMRIIAQVAPVGARLMTSVGQHMDLHCTALGKAVAAHLAEPELACIIECRGLLPHNEHTIISHRRLCEELAATRRRGYAIDDQEYAVGYRCLGAAVLDGSQRPVAAVSLFGSTNQIPLYTNSDLIRELTQAAKIISASLRGETYPEPETASEAS